MSALKIMCILFVGFIAGCQTNPVTKDNNQPVDNTPFAVSKSASVQREVIGSDDPRINQQANSINQFAVKMYLQLTKENKGNLIFSPYSITTALGMTDAGAVGTTDEQIRNALHVTLSGEDFHAGLNGLDQSLSSFSNSSDGLKLNIINSLWVQDSFPLRVSFLDILSRHYDAGVNLLDFMDKPDSSRIIINNWVSDQTNEKIKELIPQGAIKTDTRLVLTNAIYFLADWLFKFNPEKTSDQTFHREDGSDISVPMMQLIDTGSIKLLFKDFAWDNSLYQYVHSSDNAKMLELPYKGNRIVMDFILPLDSLSAYESQMNVNEIQSLINGLDSAKMPPVRIPRFQFSTSSISLKKAFNNLGMTVPFTESADFSGICQAPIYVADILHKAFIKVDETGTEAAAATAVMMPSISVHPEPSFTADRPFIYLIRDTKTNTILFMGRVVDPMVTD